MAEYTVTKVVVRDVFNLPRDRYEYLLTMMLVSDRGKSYWDNLLTPVGMNAGDLVRELREMADRIEKRVGSDDQLSAN